MLIVNYKPNRQKYKVSIAALPTFENVTEYPLSQPLRKLLSHVHLTPTSP